MNDINHGTASSEFPADEVILAWLDGELAPAEAEAFAARLSIDGALRTLVEHTRQTLLEAREWVHAEPPGVDAVELLPIPLLEPVAPPARVVDAPGRNRVHWPRLAWLARGLAAAAIFVIGFLAGQLNRQSAAAPASPSATESLSRLARQLSSGENHSQTGGAGQGQEQARNYAFQATPLSWTDSLPATPTVTRLRSEKEAAGLSKEPTPPTPTAREENGRVIVETRLTGSGGRAVWVVDGGFQVASSH